jgi:hypothetical protein
MVWNVPLNNLRMDMGEITFMIHRVGNTNPTQWAGEEGVISTSAAGGYGGSYAESNPSCSILFPNYGPVVAAGSFATQVQVTSFTLTAAGKNLFTYQTDFHNKTHVRKFYHPDAQLADFVYTIPFARYVEDRANATGHMSASVLGNLALIINLPNPGNAITYQCDVYVHSHNLMQSRAGGIVKALY